MPAAGESATVKIHISVRIRMYTPKSIYCIAERFFYNNWGWGGTANGWYFVGDAWNAQDGPDRVERWVSATQGVVGRNYNNNNRMILGITK